ncbi:MAG TPA: zinc-binding dehydrogenase [Acidimicrobiales bacterium]|nr:zinc-binding dehydrogenase [Acidimicrobiales bacterium]
MKSVVITGERQAGVVQCAEPKAEGDIVKVELRVVPMCTEFKGYAAGAVSDRLGHEAAGVVVDAGNSRRVAAGDRVVVMPQYGCGVCRFCSSGEHIYCANQRDVLSETGSSCGTATFAEYLIKPDWLLLPIPSDVSVRHASMACCGLGPSFNAMRTMRVGVTDTVLVIGCGPVGLGAVVNAVARGAAVVAVDVNHYRLELAERLGALRGVDPTDPGAVEEILDLTRGEGVDATFDSSGSPTAVELLEEVVHPLSRLSFVVLGQPVGLRRLVQRGLEVHGCWHWNHLRDASEMFGTIRRSKAALDTLVTHAFPLEQVNEAFRTQLSGNCGKVLLFPFAEETF